MKIKSSKRKPASKSDAKPTTVITLADKTLAVPIEHARTITREFELFHSVIPASADDPGRKRTAYFYRKNAVGFARGARDLVSQALFPGHRELWNSIAKKYLSLYRTALSARSQS